MGKKILIISQHFYPEIGSAGNRMKNIYQLLVEEGNKVDVITGSPSYPNQELYDDSAFWDHEELNELNNKLIRVKSSRYKNSRNMLRRLFFFLEITMKMIFEVMKIKKKYDYIYVSSPPIFIPIVGLLAKYQLKSKLILEVRDLWPESLKGVKVFDFSLIIKVFSMVEKLLYKKSDAIVVNSLAFIKHIQKLSGVPKSKVFYLPNAARAYELEERINRVDEFKVIYTGNVGLAQDVDFLKEFSMKLNKEQISFTIIGYGVKIVELKKFVEKEKLNNIIFINPITRKQSLVEIRKHDVGIVSLNDKEVFDTVLPGKVVDYITCQTPIVGSVSGYTKEIITTNNIGYVSEKRDVGEIYQYIKYLRDNPKEHSVMVENCRKSLEKDFLWEKNLEIFNEIFNI